MDIYLEFEYYPEDKEYSFVNPLINNKPIGDRDSKSEKLDIINNRINEIKEKLSNLKSKSMKSQKDLKDIRMCEKMLKVLEKKKIKFSK